MALNLSGLQAFAAGLQAAIDRGAHRAATYVTDLAVDLAPEDEGDLKATGRVEPDAPDGSGQARVVFGGASGPHKYVDYAGIVEHGNPDEPNYPAQPYLEPATKAIDVKAEIAAELRALAARSRRS